MSEMPGCGMSTKESRRHGGRQINREGMCTAGSRAEVWAPESSGNSTTHSRLGVCNTALALHWPNLASLSPHLPYQNKNVYSVILSIGVTYGLFYFLFYRSTRLKDCTESQRDVDFELLNSRNCYRLQGQKSQDLKLA